MLVGILVFLMLVALLILVLPNGASKVAEWTGTTAAKVKDSAVTVVGAVIGLLLISFGVGALAVPFIGISLIVVGLGLAAWALYTSGWFGNSAARIPIDDKSKLQKVV